MGSIEDIIKIKEANYNANRISPEDMEKLNKAKQALDITIRKYNEAAAAPSLVKLDAVERINELSCDVACLKFMYRVLEDSLRIKSNAATAENEFYRRNEELNQILDRGRTV